jgi:hypothetical protein
MAKDSSGFVNLTLNASKGVHKKYTNESKTKLFQPAVAGTSASEHSFSSKSFVSQACVLTQVRPLPFYQLLHPAIHTGEGPPANKALPYSTDFSLV